MDVVPSDWSERHKKLNKIIRKAECFTESVDMILNLHKDLHASIVSKLNGRNLIDGLLDDLNRDEYAIMPTSKDETIAWAIWHIARIEDLTMNILINNSDQVFDDSWKTRMNISISDTGNAMTDDEIMNFSKRICISELLKYRNVVGIKSREIVKNLCPIDMKRKILPNATSRILREGGVTEQADSIWLLDFWGKKDVAGIILMPLTRHQTLHLNDCYKWKKSIRTKKKFFAV
jgi:hypothetical protein